MKTNALFRTPYLLLRLHCHISDRQNPEAREVRPRSIGPHSSAEGWNHNKVFTSQSTTFSWSNSTGKIQSFYSTQSIHSQHKVFTVNTKYLQSTQSIYSQRKGIRQQMWTILDRSRKSSSRKLGNVFVLTHQLMMR